jgi:hypothetical protein
MQTNTSFFTRTLLACLVLFSAASAYSQEKSSYTWPVKLQKDYTKTYPLTNELLAVMNRYGKMTIETWDKNEIKVDAQISVGAQNNEYAAKMLERINIIDEKKTDRIEFVTKLGDWNDDNNNGGHEMRIDLVVHIPATAKLYAENNFGPLTIGNYKGEVELVCKYGTLTAGILSNSKNIRVEFGKAVIESVNDSKLLFKYSRVDIAKLSGSIDAEFQFCNSMDIPIDNSLKKLELKNNYTSLYFVAPKDFTADYEISTNNARVTAKNDIIKEDIPANPNGYTRLSSFTPNHKYVGSLGKGGGTQISIKSNFGNIRFM